MSAPPPSAPEPLSAAELAGALEALGPFERAPRLAVAVSGGPDSLALALLAASWARRRGGAVLGLTVDHGLRPESAAEAAQVAAWLGAHGIACRVLTWPGPRPATGIQEAARAARHALLAAACREAAILHLLLAHHARDQAETVLMRAERGSGEQGLAGMAAVSERHGFRLLRPLLQVMPERLRATLAAMGQPWLEDPSNVAPQFRRAGLRVDPGFEPERWLATAGAAAAARAEADREVARFAALAITPDPLGYLTLALDRWRELPAGLGGLVLARCIVTASGRGYPPAAAGMAALAARLRAARAPSRTTLGGALLVRRGDRLLIGREPGRIRDRIELVDGAEQAWDGRFRVRYRGGPPLLTLAALGTPGHLRPEIRAALRARRVPAAFVAALPGLRHGEALLASPLHPAAPGMTAAFTLQPALPVAPAPFAGPNVV